MRKIFGPILAAAFACAIYPVAADAGVITAPVGTYFAFPADEYVGTGPQSFSGITWSSTNAATEGGAVFGYDMGYGFGTNGLTYDAVVGLNDNSEYDLVVDSLTFAFASPVSAIGAVLNWRPNAAPVTSISVYDSTNALIESYTLSSGDSNLSNTPDSFFGFQETTPTIASFVLTDGDIAAIGGLSVAVPEPATWALMVAGFGLVGLGLRQGKRRKAVSFV